MSVLKMAFEARFVLRVIVRVVGPAPSAVGVSSPGEEVAPWTIACRIPATR